MLVFLIIESLVEYDLFVTSIFLIHIQFFFLFSLLVETTNKKTSNDSSIYWTRHTIGCGNSINHLLLLRMNVLSK